MKLDKISDAVIRRLPLYMRVLDDIARKGSIQLVSSYELGDKAGVSPALVRKDLAWFGEFGKQGVGYEVDYLRMELRRILNLDREHKVVLVGAGSLGTALARYNIKRYNTDDDFNLNIIGLFDNDPQKIGKNYDGIEIRSISEITQFVKENKVKMAIITVPVESAQEVALKLIDGGVGAILNFAPVKLDLPENVHVLTADLTLEFKRLAYYLDDE
ncbi:MAG: redox-sensing transcriptional repressor Rex [Firmicutes bacterium]|nr:redox-sensing transcriptional repressor Rex [Bacillota bacterium]